MTKENDNLDFDKAKDLTIGEAVRKDAELQAGVTDNDGVLDKYIKQHREEVASQKFETKEVHLEELDTAALDAFIQKQRQEAQDGASAVTATQVTQNTQQVDAVAESVVREEPKVAAESVTLADHASILQDSETLNDKPFYQKRGPILLGLLLLLLAALGIAYGINQFNSNESSPNATQESTSSETLDSSNEDASAQALTDNESFHTLYEDFFVSEAAGTLKNSSFEKLPELEALLGKLEGTKFYDAAKEKYDGLKEQIDGIQAVNAKFDQPIIVDGAIVDTAKPKADANFDDLSVEILNTGNASLDNLLQSAVKKGRDALGDVKTSASSASENQATNESGDNATNSASAANAQSESQQAPAVAAPAPTPVVPTYGISGYDSNSLQRHLSRVPYNQTALADASNSAWQFAPGILETVVSKAQERGHISGNQYILERVNIVNGNGYYNMFKPDGTYLFSINAKTGYFVGNKPGRSDALDY